MTQVDDARQHDDHIWLCVGGEMWGVFRMHPEAPHFIWLWRGYYPHLEFKLIDTMGVDWEEYGCRCLFQLYGDTTDWMCIAGL